MFVYLLLEGDPHVDPCEKYRRLLIRHREAHGELVRADRAGLTVGEHISNCIRFGSTVEAVFVHYLIKENWFAYV